jgi:putative SOS response-associated peptidase YedK
MKMCGRYLISTDNDYDEIMSIINEVSEKYKKTNLANGEVFPTNNVPVIYYHNGKNILSAAKWGFPNFKNSGVIINARCETVSVKPMFRKSFATQRCLLPANGYYEWLTQDKKKTKYQIAVKDMRLFYMAGLYNIFKDDTGVPYSAVTIITTEANGDVSFIHDRMPVILPTEAADIWLDIRNTDLTDLQDLLHPYEIGKMNFAVM